MAEQSIQIGLTGARGVLGKTLQKIWPEVNWKIFNGDIRDLQQVQTWYKEIGPVQGIVHFAALVPTHLVEAEPLRALATNVQGTCHLLETIRTSHTTQSEIHSKNIPWIFLTSTSHVYASSSEPVSENSPLNPISLYGLTKLQAEEWAKIYQKKYQFPICIGRVFSFSSHLQPNTYFIPSMIQKISAAPTQSTIEIPGLHGTRDFLTAEEVCLGIKELFKKKTIGIFNIASGHPQKLLDIVTLIQNRLNRQDVEVLAPKTGTHHLVANVESLEKLNIRLKFNLNHFLETLLHKEPK